MSQVLLEDTHYHLARTDEGIIECRLRGDIDREDIIPLMEFLRGYYQTEDGVLFLNDFSDVGELSLSARWYAAEQAKHNRRFIKRSAIFGFPPSWRILGQVFFKVSGRTDIQAFNSRPEAVRWLLAG